MARFTMKFGGTSVGSPAAIEQVAKIVRDHLAQGHELAVVVSAMSGITDMLLESAAAAAAGDKDSCLAINAAIGDRHLAVIDALIGYGLSGPPRGRAADLIHLANSSVAPILSLDMPSGLDASGGPLVSPHIAASVTMTLALPKLGLLQPEANAACGQLYLADIGVPPALYERLELDLPPLFAGDTILPLQTANLVARVEGLDAIL